MENVSNSGDAVGESTAGSETTTNVEELKRDTVRGGAVTLMSQAASVAIQLVSTVVLARLLVPEDYGVIAMVAAVTTFAGLFRDLGLSAASIQKKDLTSAQQSNLFWLNVAMGILLTVIVAIGAPLVAWFYSRPELKPVTMALSLSFVINSLGSQSGALLVRHMRFGRKAIAQLSGAVVTLAIAVPLALSGWTYWALVWGTLAGSATTTLLLFVLSPFRPGWPSRGSGVRDMLRFGADVTGFNLVNYFHRNLDNLLIGRYWGADALGLYSRAYALMMFPLHAIRGPINAVTFPALSRLQNDSKRFRAFVCKSSNAIAMLSMPIAAFAAVSSRLLIIVVLGPNWKEASTIFTCLAVAGFIQPVAAIRGQIMLSTGATRKYLVWGVVNAVLVSLAFLLGIAWGPVGVAIAYAAATFAIFIPSLVYATRGSAVQPTDILAAIACPAFSSVVAALALAAKKMLWNTSADFSIGTLCLDMVLFAVVYLGAYFGSSRGRSEMRNAFGYLKIALGRTSSVAS